jgi:hypothetical protein
MSLMGQSRRLGDVGMSASPPTTDLSLRRSEPTLWARNGLMRCNKSWGLEFCCQTFSSSSKVLACFKSSVSKPSVNQPYTGASSSRACCGLP